MLTILCLAFQSDVPARGDVDEAVGRDSRGVEHVLVVGDAAFGVAICVLGVEEFQIVVAGWFRRLAVNFEESVRLRIRSIENL